MRTFSYTARDSKTGSNVNSEVDASDEVEAAKALSERGLSALEIKAKTNDQYGSLSHRIPAKERVIFSRQLSTLINAGLPLVQSLRTVSDQMDNKNLQEIIHSVINDVEAGASFSDGLSKFPRIFNDVYISLVAAGEASGTLDKSLARLADQQEKDGEIVSKVRGALVYPLIVILVLIGVVVFMMTTVLPQVENFYKTLPGVNLPFITVWLLDISHVVTHFWWVMILLLIFTAYIGLRWSKTVTGKKTLDELKIKLPLLKPLFMKIYMARFARTGSTLIASGVPMIRMLNTTADAVGNVHVADSIHRATVEVKGGKALSESLRGDPNFLPLVPDMIHIGEQSGSLEGMMGKVADYYEKEVDNQIKGISTVIEPVLMIVVGIMALIIVAAILLPIYGLAGKNLLSN